MTLIESPAITPSAPLSASGCFVPFRVEDDVVAADVEGDVGPFDATIL